MKGGINEDNDFSWIEDINPLTREEIIDEISKINYVSIETLNTLSEVLFKMGISNKSAFFNDFYDSLQEIIDEVREDTHNDTYDYAYEYGYEYGYESGLSECK